MGHGPSGYSGGGHVPGRRLVGMEPMRSSHPLVVGARSTGALALVTTAYYTVPGDVGGGPLLSTLLFSAALLVLAGLIVYLIMHEPTESGRVPRAEPLLIVVYLALVCFAEWYYRLAHVPGRFVGLGSKTDALYFSLTTAATVGFGDIHAVSQGAKIVVMFQIVFDIVFVGAGLSIALGRLRDRTRPPSGPGTPRAPDAGA